ncbi:MAG: carboxypeptidase-like regulatory domain-containing protein, partial [Tannerella sp.]|nr:carboxypeptidase-like regulatory domain-containing protein [Tannerella sp.]
MKRKISILVVMFCACASIAFAQHQVSGVVRDGTDGSPLPYATAALLRPDSSVVTGVVTGDSGRFVISGVNPGNYLLQVSFIGYNKEYVRVSVPA